MTPLFLFMNTYPGWTFLFLLIICSLIGSIVKSITRIFVKHECRCDLSQFEEDGENEDEDDDGDD